MGARGSDTRILYDKVPVQAKLLGFVPRLSPGGEEQGSLMLFLEVYTLDEVRLDFTSCVVRV
jgi:hypothetical protein